MMHKKIDFLGISVGSVTRRNIVDMLLYFAESNEKKLVFYLNAHCVNVAFSDKAYCFILNKADLVYAGGMGVVWASRFLGRGLFERVNILDFFDSFLREARLRKVTFYLLGNSKEIVAKTAEVFTGNGLNIVGYRDGFFTSEEEKDIIREINTLKPNILIVGTGVPKQEKWIYEHYQELRVNLFWGVGAAFYWLSGQRKRAPQWMILCGIEWLHRLCQQPERLWKRYLIGNLFFVFRVLNWKIFHGQRQ